MNVSLARESLGEGPRATPRCTGRYKVEATADVLSQADMELGTEATVQTSLSDFVLGIGRAQPTRGKKRQLEYLPSTDMRQKSVMG